MAQARCQGPEVAKPTFDSAIQYVERLDALLSIRAGEMAQVARRQAEVGQAEAARLTFDQAVDLACARDPPMGICLQGAGAGSDCEGTGVVREVGPGV